MPHVSLATSAAQLRLPVAGKGLHQVGGHFLTRLRRVFFITQVAGWLASMRFPDQPDRLDFELAGSASVSSSPTSGFTKHLSLLSIKPAAVAHALNVLLSNRPVRLHRGLTCLWSVSVFNSREHSFGLRSCRDRRGLT